MSARILGLLLLALGLLPSAARAQTEIFARLPPGLFQAPDCTQLQTPVVGKSFCLDNTANVLKSWTGTTTGWLGDVDGLAVQVSPPGAAQINLISRYSNPTPSTGALQHVGAAFGITTSASGSQGHIALYAGGQTRPADLNTGNLWAINSSVFNTAGDATTTFLIGQESDIGNNRVDSALNCIPPTCFIGHSVVSTGTKKASYAYNVSGNGQWQQGYEADQGSIATGGFAFNYKGDGVNGNAAIRADSTIQLGFTATALGNPNEVHLGNNRFIQFLNAAGTNLVAALQVNNNNQVNLAPVAATPVLIGGIPFVSTGTPAISGAGCTVGANTVDSWGSITLAASTTCTVTFSHTLTNAPKCTVSDNSTVTFFDVSAVSNTAVTFTAGAGVTGTLYYTCLGAT